MKLARCASCLLAVGIPGVLGQLQQSPLNDGAVATSTSRTKELLSFHRKLVEHESVSGNEGSVGDFLVDYLASKGMSGHMQYLPASEESLSYPVGLDHRVQSSRKGKKRSNRFNVWAWFGKHAPESRTRVILTSHIDTVPPFYHYNTSSSFPDPDAWISGRGSVDAKASVAAQVFALTELIDEGAVKEDEVALLFVVGEEDGGDGMDYFSQSDLAKNVTVEHMPTVIFGEPTEAKLVCGHKGIMQFYLRTTGKAAHSGYPWLGVSANLLMLKALDAIQTLVETKALPQSEKYGETTVNFGTIVGGVAANVVAQEASSHIAIRLAGGDPRSVAAQIEDAVGNATKELLTKGGDVRFEYRSEGFPPTDIDCEGPEGFETITVNYGTDIVHLTFDGQAYRRFLYGPGSILVAHGDHEMLQVKDLERAVDDYKKLVLYSLES